MKFDIAPTGKDGKSYKIVISEMQDGDWPEVEAQRDKILHLIRGMHGSDIQTGEFVNEPIADGQLLQIIFTPPEKLKTPLSLEDMQVLFSNVKNAIELPEAKPEVITISPIPGNSEFVVLIHGAVNSGNRSAYQALRNAIKRKLKDVELCKIANESELEHPAEAGKEIIIKFKLPAKKAKLDIADIVDWFKAIKNEYKITVNGAVKKTLVLSDPTAAEGQVRTIDPKVLASLLLRKKLEALGAHLTNPKNIEIVRAFLQQAAATGGVGANELLQAIGKIQIPKSLPDMPAGVKKAKSVIRTAGNILGRDTVANFVAMLVTAHKYVEKKKQILIMGEQWQPDDIRELLLQFAKKQMEKSAAMGKAYPSLQLAWQGYLKTSKLMSENATVIAAVYVLYASAMVKFSANKYTRALNLLYYAAIATVLSANVKLYNDRAKLCEAIVKAFETKDRGYETLGTSWILNLESWVGRVLGLGGLENLERDWYKEFIARQSQVEVAVKPTAKITDQSLEAPNPVVKTAVAKVEKEATLLSKAYAAVQANLPTNPFAPTTTKKRKPRQGKQDTG